MIGRDARILLAHLSEGSHPQVMPEGEHVALVHHRELLLLAGLRELEGVADAALHAHPCVDRLLHRNLVRSALAQRPANARVEALGVLPHHHEVNLLRALVLQRCLHTRVELDRPQVDVLVKLEAQLEQDALLEDAGGHIRVADCAEVDRVELAQLGEHRGRQDLAGLEEAVAADVVVRGLVLNSVGSRGDIEDLQALGHDLRANSVAGQHSYPVHERFLLA